MQKLFDESDIYAMHTSFPSCVSSSSSYDNNAIPDGKPVVLPIQYKTFRVYSKPQMTEPGKETKNK